jgi:hypothetical protein
MLVGSRGQKPAHHSGASCRRFMSTLLAGVSQQTVPFLRPRRILYLRTGHF